MKIDSTKSKVILYHFLCSGKMFNRIYGGVWLLSRKMCRNKCNFKYYFLEICVVEQPEILHECY